MFFTQKLLNSKSLLVKAVGFFVEMAQVVVFSLMIIIPVRYFLIQPFYVKGASMEPSFYENEYLIIDEFSYRFREPERGEVVVFRYPLDKEQYFIKRIIAMPGEHIEISDGKITLKNSEYPDGFVLNEDLYLPSDIFTSGEREIDLGDNEYFLLGDHRSASMDSRVFGPVDKSLIIGRVLLRGWPIDRLGLISRPAYSYNLQALK
jgi:signal peptidase I